MDLKEYISTVNQKYRAGNATEHTYRGVLEQLMQSLLPKLRIVNEPKRVKCGAPDYIARATTTLTGVILMVIRNSLRAISRPSTILSSLIIWTSICMSMASLWIACVLQK